MGFERTTLHVLYLSLFLVLYNIRGKAYSFAYSTNRPYSIYQNSYLELNKRNVLFIIEPQDDFFCFVPQTCRQEWILIYWNWSIERVRQSRIKNALGQATETFVCLLVVLFLQSVMYHETEMMQKAYYKIVHSIVVIIIHIEDIEEIDHPGAVSAKTPDVLPRKKVYFGAYGTTSAKSHL